MSILHKRPTYIIITIGLISAGLYLTQCRNDTKSINTTTTPTITTPTDTSKMQAVAIKTDTAKPKHAGIATKSVTPVDTLFVDVNSKGIVFLGDEQMDSDFLRRRLVDSLNILKKQTGQYPKQIKLRTHGEVLMGVRGEIKDVIQEAKDSLKIK